MSQRMTQSQRDKKDKQMLGRKHIRDVAEEYKGMHAM